MARGSGLGSLSFDFASPGQHSLVAWFDFEITDPLDPTNFFFDEFGSAAGAPAAGQSWEIDEPGFVFGDVFLNTLAGDLDKTNSIPENAPEDVSFALGWNFVLDAGEQAVIDLTLADAAPQNSAFHLAHTDPATASSLFYSSSLEISRAPTEVPEPGILGLLAIGLLGLAWPRRMRTGLPPSG